jgi:tripartite-type tricarboxylate transporter receptor subunit TctC
MPRRRTPLGGAVAALASVLALPAAAADFPSQPITIVVPFAPGGPIDKSARTLAQALSKQLGGASVQVDYVPGSAGTTGTAYVTHSPKDGHTLLIHHVGLATSPTFWPKLSYDVLNDLAPLGLVAETPMTLIGRPTLIENRYDEVLRLVRKKPTPLNLANAGVGSASHLCGLLLQSRWQVALPMVSYRGTGPAMSDLLAGQVDLMCDQTTSTAPLIEAGRVKAYAVTTGERLSTPGLKQLPTLAESGLPGFDVAVWHGLYAPAGVPEPVLKKLNVALRAALKDPNFVDTHTAAGTRIVSDERVTPEGHRKFLAAEMARWASIIKSAGAYAN